MVSLESPNTNTHEALTLQRVFKAPIERVFDAWTNADVLAEWFGPDGFIVTTAEIDLRLGGKYQLVLRAPDGAEIKHFGEYIEIVRPEKLVFTWILENQACAGSQNQCATTLVSIVFKQIGATTEIQLTHERLPDKAACDGHRFGWSSSFDKLEKFLLARLK